MNDESTRSKIILAAGPIFASKGYRAATVREICEAAHVNVASVNYYFGDKQQLYSETVVVAREMRVQQVPNPTFSPDTPPEKKLEGFIAMLLNRLVALETEPWQVRLLMRELLQPTEASQKLIEDYFRPFLEMLMGIVDEIVGRELANNVRQQIAFSIIGQCLHYRFTAEMTKLLIVPEPYETSFSKEQLVKHITRFSMSGIQSYSSKVLSTVKQNG